MHPVIEFYLEQRKSQHNLSLQDMWAMPMLRAKKTAKKSH